MKAKGLVDLSIVHKTDKWGGHYYARHYDRHLENFREKKVVILEIGVGGYADPLAGGASLRVWSDWFSHPETVIIGVDINEKIIEFDDPRVKVHRGSQVDKDFLAALHEMYGDFDIVIDDGSHLPEHVIDTFKILYPRVRDGGIYIIEDTQTSYWRGGRAGSPVYNPENPTYAFFKSLPDWINYAEIPLPSEPEFYDLHTVGAHFYHNLIIIDKDRNDERSNIIESRLGGGVRRFAKPLVAPMAGTKDQKLLLLAHVGGVGDVVNRVGGSVATDGRSPRFIQGFALKCNSEDEVNIECRARLASGEWTQWSSGNVFIGTRGKSEALTGFSVRLSGEWEDRYDLMTIGSFHAVDGLIIKYNGDDCVPDGERRPLTGMQVMLLPSRS